MHSQSNLCKINPLYFPFRQDRSHWFVTVIQEADYQVKKLYWYIMKRQCIYFYLVDHISPRSSLRTYLPFRSLNETLQSTITKFETKPTIYLVSSQRQLVFRGYTLSRELLVLSRAICFCRELFGFAASFLVLPLLRFTASYFVLP